MANADNIHTKIRSDPDTLSVDELIVCVITIVEGIVLVFSPLASHVTSTPVLLEVLNYLISVFKHFSSNTGEVVFSKLRDYHFEKDCEWANQALVPAPVCEVPLEVAKSKGAQPNEGEQDGL